MTIKDKLTIGASIALLVLLVLFSGAWVADGMGIGTYDLPIMIQALEVIKGVLSVVLGGGI